MVYVPNQVSVFLAAFTGALGGSESGRALTSAFAGNYANPVNAALAYAQEFDTLYGTAGDSSSASLQTLTEVSYAIFDGRAVLSATPTDYTVECNAIIALLTEQQTLLAALVPSGLNAPAFRARNVVQTNVAALFAYTVAAGASNDNVTSVAGDVILLAAQTTPAQNGPYVVGTVAAGHAPLTRPSWWQSAAMLKTGLRIAVGGEGTIFKNTVWQAMLAADSFIVDTNDPQLYPEEVTVHVSLGGGAPTGQATITTVPIRSTNVGVAISRVLATTPAATVMYAATNNGAAAITAGIIGAASLTVEAAVAAGTTNAADGSLLNVTITNQL